ncbi:receptor-like cytosolic serine/threonine-protein kinase RBK1 [Juglans microcarpa x Juglans regia]|uniref:receptor-like cytosolic serine/threonine-protein kinase RBK1 n=1 Tax=Juglans microcarpa x Juglans regia TaxID=2249226 RepID=UPI001B7ECE94|nr:receptor-like cytosolic serine/threonine-protein kinase RBK1 [Juglans microcarpa x Juglans regia]
MEENTSLRDEEAPENVKSESHAIHTAEHVLEDNHGALKTGSCGLNYHEYKEEAPLNSISLFQKELPESTLGWPLLRKTALANQKALRKSKGRNLSVVEWVMSLPTRSTSLILQHPIALDLNKTDIPSEREAVNSAFEEGDNEDGTLHQAVGASEDETVGSSRKPEENSGLVCEYKEEVSSSSASFLIKDSPQWGPGWPLLKISASASSDFSRDSEDRNMSVVQGLMSLPNLSNSAIPQTQTGEVSNKIESHIERERCFSEDLDTENNSTDTESLLKELEFLMRTNFTGCRWFSYKELNSATSNFSSENLVGEGGCSKVYRGCLPCGRSVAVKVLKSYEEAWNDFYAEMDIITTLKHKHISPLIGACLEDDYLISVYDFFSVGNLEELLHGHGNRSVLPWEVRFKVAVAVAEALNYLHKECPRPVIHRDVKSSNILLSNEFQPQLSDFGLSIWGPTDSPYEIHSDVVGTFGYIAPEYFMRGRVSNKIDVYSFGVVLLELISGRKPIDYHNLKEQISLVQWAKPLLESGDVKALLDPKLEEDLDVDQMHKMVLAASLCIIQSARLRPKMSQILKILKGEKDAEECVDSHNIDTKELGNQDEDDLYPEFGCKRQSDSALLQTENDNNSLSSGDTETCLGNGEKPRHFMLKEYLKQRQG